MTSAPHRARAILTCAALAALNVLSASGSAAQDYRPGESRRGTFVVTPDERDGDRLADLAQRRTALALASAVLDVFRRDPAISAPVGYLVKLHRVIGAHDMELGREPAMPYYAGVSGTYWGYFLKDDTPDPDASGKTPFEAYVNTLWACPYSEDYAVEDRGKPMADGGRPILAGPRKTGEFRGHPVYNGQCVVITNRSVPPFLPVTGERYAKLELLGMHAKVDRVRKQVDYDHLDPKWRAAYDDVLKQTNDVITAREAELARMSAADRAAPAAVRHNGGDDSTLVSADDPDGVPLVTINPAFFDRSLPASRAQVVVVNLPFLQAGVKPEHTPDEPARRTHAEKIRDQLDWAALEALVKP